MKNFFFGISALVLLQACTSGPSKSKFNTSAEDINNDAAIIVSYGGKTNCHSATIKYTNVDTRKEYQGRMKAGWMKSALSKKPKISVINVPAGNYRFSGGSCSVPVANGSVIHQYRNIGFWFKPFEVKSGEVVYPGTVIAEVVSHKVDGVLDFIPEFISRAPTDKYQLFGLEDRSSFAQSKLNELDHSKSSLFVTRIADKRLEQDVMKKIIADSYKYEGKKKGPDSQDAHRKLGLSVMEYMMTGKYDPKS